MAFWTLRHLLPALDLKCEALFFYRNAIFHNGFEWPTSERKRFDTERGTWPSSWFYASTSTGATWTVYMTDEFINEWMRALDRIIDGIGAFAQELVE